MYWNRDHDQTMVSKFGKVYSISFHPLSHSPHTCTNIHHLCTVLESALLKKSSLAFDSNSRRQVLLFLMSFFGLFV